MGNLLEQSKKLGLDIDGAVRFAYAAFREDDFTVGRPPDEEIARTSSCYGVAPRVAGDLSRQLSRMSSRTRRLLLGYVGLKAFAEFHDPDLPKLELDHAYALIGGKDPRLDIVVDSTYQQFLRPEVWEQLPLAFIGTREEAQVLMRDCAIDPSTARYYQQETLDQSKTQWMGSEFGITHPRL